MYIPRLVIFLRLLHPSSSCLPIATEISFSRVSSRLQCPTMYATSLSLLSFGTTMPGPTTFFILSITPFLVSLRTFMSETIMSSFSKASLIPLCTTWFDCLWRGYDTLKPLSTLNDFRSFLFFHFQTLMMYFMEFGKPCLKFHLQQSETKQTYYM